MVTARYHVRNSTRRCPLLGLIFQRKQWTSCSTNGTMTEAALLRMQGAQTHIVWYYSAKEEGGIEWRRAAVNQLAEALKANASRVMDLFRSWDRDGDGEVSED